MPLPNRLIPATPWIKPKLIRSPAMVLLVAKRMPVATPEITPWLVRSPDKVLLEKSMALMLP